jgi:hypothetical protein
MQRSIVHIGYHKTATTWFQERYYPLVKNATYITRRQAKQAFLNVSAFNFDPRHAREILGTNEPMLICEENLCGDYENAGLLGCLSKDVAYRIRNTLPEAQIVIFIRNQPDMIAATYLQYLRRGGTASVNHFLFPYRHQRRFSRKHFKKPMFLFDHFDYLNLIHHYQDIFGKPSVHVFPYEAFSRNPSDFIAGYGHRFELDVDFERIDFRPKNRSYRGGTVHVARLLNYISASDADAVYGNCRIRVVPKKLKGALMEGWNRSPWKGQRLTPQQLLGPKVIHYIQERFADSNRVLAAALDLPLAGYGYPMG